MPLSSEPNSAFAWSFDRVVAGEAYAEETVQPVLHRYNDAKYVWDDASARAWLAGFVRAHSVLDLEVEDGDSAYLPIVVD